MKILLYFFSLIYLFSISPSHELELQDKPEQILIRVFKYEKILELWYKKNDTFHLEKKYTICRTSGILGPKRKEGDFQVPEGFYYIKDFNPYSKYKKSLGISYPNKSDSILSPYKNLGGSIYIHGDCVSVGCIAVGDKFIEDIYSRTKTQNTRIEIHIFPVDFSCPESQTYLKERLQNNLSLTIFERNLETGFWFFEEKKKIPVVSVNDEGYYEFN